MKKTSLMLLIVITSVKAHSQTPAATIQPLLEKEWDVNGYSFARTNFIWDNLNLVATRKEQLNLNPTIKVQILIKQT